MQHAFPARGRAVALRLATAAVAFLWAGSCPAARADDAPPADDERQEAIDRHTEKGWKAFRSGNHEEVLQRMERLAALDPKDPLPKYLTARVHARTGKYEEALKGATDALAAHPEDRALEALRFDMLQRLGRSDEAATAASAALAANPEDLVARTVRGLLLEDRGRRKEAMAEYEAVIASYNKKDPPSEELPWVAQAAIRAHHLSTNPKEDLLPGALGLLKRRLEADPDDVDAQLVYANVFQEDHGASSQWTAGGKYRAILNQNSEIAEARVGQARIFLIRYDEAQAIRDCQRALATNPSLVPAMNILAAIHVGDGDYKKADEMWLRAYAVNPVDKEARAIRAARLFVSGEKAGYEAMEKELLAHDPTYGRLYTTVADLVGERQRRFDVAAELSEKAIAIDPNDDQAYVVQGVNLMNLGREDEARKSFEQSIDAAKGYKDLLRDNFLEVLEHLKTFVTTKSEHFVVKQHVSESAVMEPYLLPLLERAWKDLSAKYAFMPEGPVLVESFHRHDDFSVRSVGAQNIPALGVCFGKVITLDGPYSRGLGEFSWARTAWHEFAHVVTLQMSKGQVPRWLTEGLSVHEEKAHKPQWGREMEDELHDRWKNGRLLKMADINGAFRGPDVMFAYYQGGLIADFIQKEWGFEAVQKMLKRHADDVPTEKTFEEVLKVPLAEFDAKFTAYVGGLVAGYKRMPRWDEESKAAFEARTKKDARDAEAWVRLGWAHVQRGRPIEAGAALEKARAVSPDLPEAILLEGELAMRAQRLDLAEKHYRRFLDAGGDDLSCRMAMARIAMSVRHDSEEAVKQMNAAKACFPRYVGRGNPYLELAKLYEGESKPAKAVAELEAFAEIAQEDYGVRRKLAAWYKDRHDDAALLRVSEEMVEINPFGAKKGDPPDLDLHRDYAEALLRAGRKEEGVREWRVQTLLIDTLPEEARAKAGGVEARLALGNLYLELEKPDDALEQAQAALRLAPDSLPAKALKDRARAAGGGR